MNVDGDGMSGCCGSSNGLCLNACNLGQIGYESFCIKKTANQVFVLARCTHGDSKRTHSAGGCRAKAQADLQGLLGSNGIRMIGPSLSRLIPVYMVGMLTLQGV